MDNQKLHSISGSGMPTSRDGKCLVVFGTKGGVGKTVVAINVAVGLAKRLKKPVCLVDLDMMAVGDLAKALNVSTPHPIVDLMPKLKRAATPASSPTPPDVMGPVAVSPATLETVVSSLESVMTPHGSGVHILTCLSHPRQLNQLEPRSLAVLFHALKQRYAYVVIDGGKTFSEPLIAAFDAANLILLVATPDIMTLYQTKWALGMLESLLFPSSMVKVVLNRAESRGSLGTPDSRAAIPCDIIGEIPSDGRTVGPSHRRKVGCAGSSSPRDSRFRTRRSVSAPEQACTAWTWRGRICASGWSTTATAIPAVRRSGATARATTLSTMSAGGCATSPTWTSTSIRSAPPTSSHCCTAWSPSHSPSSGPPLVDQGASAAFRGSRGQEAP